MTDSTPTGAEVARYDPLFSLGEMLQCPDGPYVRFTDYQALRERAEAAERTIERLDKALSDGMQSSITSAERYVGMMDALTEARRAEAAAWNDAIEAAGDVVDEQHWSKGGVSDAAHEAMADRIRALRRAAPTEGEA